MKEHRGRRTASHDRDPLPQDALLEILDRHLTSIVIITDATIDEPGPRILYVNERFTELTGYSQSEVLGLSPRFLQGPDTNRHALARIRDALEKGNAVTETLANYARDGTRLDLELRITPLVGRAGRPTHFVAIQRDVTRERAHRQRIERLMAATINALDFGVLVNDENGRCMVANVHCISLMGMPLQAVIGTPVHDLLPGLDLDAAHATGKPGQVKTIQLDHGRTAGRQAVTVERLPSMPGMERLAVLRIKPVSAAPAAAIQPVASARIAADEQSGVVAGRMQLVGLDAIRSALGAKWEERSDAVFELAQGVLRKRLGPRDIWRRSGEDGFVVVFAERDEATARFKANAIAEEIRSLLIGSGETEIRLTSTTTTLDMEPQVDLADDDILRHIENSIDATNAELEMRVKEQLKEGLKRGLLPVDDVRSVKRNQVFAGRLRLDDDLANDVLAARQALEDPSGALLEVQSYILAQAVRVLSRQQGPAALPLIVPFDPVLMDQRSAWSRMLDIARRITPQLRKRMMPLIDGIRAEDGAYRISDMAVTLGQIFGHAALVHPCQGELRFIADRCRLRAVIFLAEELPKSAEERKRFARLLTAINATRTRIGIDATRSSIATNSELPQHDLLIVPRAAAS